MNNHELIKNAFKDIVPSDALTERTIYMNFSENTKKIRPLKKAAAVIAAVIAVLALGITTAATGLFDFKGIFGIGLSEKDKQYGENLMSEVSDFTYEISDNRYEINLAGVSATAKRLVIAIDFTKRDGSNFKAGEIEDFFRASNYNIRINGEHTKYGTSFSHDYPSENSFREIYEMTIDEPSDEITSVEIIYSDNYNAEDIIFKVNFNIVPSDSAVSTKRYNGAGESCEIYVDVTDNVLNVLDTFTVTVKLDSITADSAGMYISGSYVIPDKYADSRYLNRSKSNSILCILTDGTEIPLVTSGGSASSENSAEWIIDHHDYCYLDPLSGEQIYLDINDVAAFSVNGKVFELK